MEKAQQLRQFNYPGGIYLQGYMDGMKVKDTVLMNVVTRQKEDEGPLR